MKKLVLFGFLVVFLTFVVVALPSREDIRYCKGTCRAVYLEEVIDCNAAYSDCMASCEGRNCRHFCNVEKRSCLKAAIKENKLCLGSCRKGFSGCLNETRDFGEVFTQGCEVCTCKRNGQISCKTDAFCNKNVSISESNCNENGGFYYQLCNGPYFDVVCSQKSYCLCGGLNEFTCGENQECFHDFLNPNRRGGSIQGFRDLLGRDLGEIGVCAVN